MSLSRCGHNPPISRCRLCKLAGLVPWQPGDTPPAGWAPPPDSPAARGEFPAAVAATPALARCRHLGTEPVGLRDCPSCRGRVRRKEFACARALGAGAAGAACPPVDCPPARACPGYAPVPPDREPHP